MPVEQNAVFLLLLLPLLMSLPFPVAVKFKILAWHNIGPKKRSNSGFTGLEEMSKSPDPVLHRQHFDT